MNPAEPMPAADRRFLWRAALVVLIALGLIGGVLLLWSTVEALLVGFAGILLAVGTVGIADGLRRVLKVNQGAAVGLAVFLILGVLTLLGWLMAPSIVQQFRQLWEALPGALALLRRQAWFEQLLRSSSEWALSALPGSLPIGPITAFVSALYNAVFQVLLALFIGIALALEPRTYVSGFLALFPSGRRGRAREVLSTLRATLQRWLLGQLLSMVAVGILTYIGLSIVGMPFALSLGVLAGLLEFVPTLGPLLASVPALLLALTQGLGSVALVAGVYVAVQTMESYLLIPFIHRYTVSVPPVVAVVAIVLLGVILGPLGVLLAMPITASALVLVRMLYIEDVLGEKG